MLRITLNFSPDIDYEGNRFSNVLAKKNLEFVLSGRNSIVAFNLSFVLLSLNIDFIL